MKRLSAISGALLSFLLASQAFAQGLEDLGPVGESLQNASFELATDVMVFPDDPTGSTADDDTAYLSVRLTMESRLDIIEALSVGYKIYAAGSNQEDEYSGAFREPGDRRARQPRYVDLDKLFLLYEGGNYDVTLGKETIETGVAEIFSPSNRFGLVNGVTPPLKKEFGVWQVAVNYALEDDTVGASIAPFHERSQIPPTTSRWFGDSQDAEFTKILSSLCPGGPISTVGPTITDDFHNPDPTNFNYLLTYEGVREGYDFFGVVHRGPAAYPVLRTAPSAIGCRKVNPISLSVGGGGSAVFDQWSFYGEAIYQRTDHDQDQDFVKYSVGVSYRDTDFANTLGWDEIKPILEFAGEEITDQQDEPGFVANSLNARPFRNAILGRVEIQRDDEWSFSFGGARNFTDKDWSVGLGGEYKPSDNLAIRLEGFWFVGDKDTHFGRWRRNEFVRGGVTYNF